LRDLVEIRAVPAVPAKEVPARALVDPAKALVDPAKALVDPAKAAPAKAVPARALVVPAKAVPAKAVPAKAVPAKELVVPAKAREVPVKALAALGLAARRPHLHPQPADPEQEDPAESAVPATHLDLRLALDQQLGLAWRGLGGWRDRVRVARVKVGQVRAEVRVYRAKAPAGQGRPELKPEVRGALVVLGRVDRAKAPAGQGRPELKPEVRGALVVLGRVVLGRVVLGRVVLGRAVRVPVAAAPTVLAAREEPGD
jgi:hypothetical protein